MPTIQYASLLVSWFLPSGYLLGGMTIYRHSQWLCNYTRKIMMRAEQAVHAMGSSESNEVNLLGLSWALGDGWDLKAQYKGKGMSKDDWE